MALEEKSLATPGLYHQLVVIFKDNKPWMKIHERTTLKPVKICLFKKKIINQNFFSLQHFSLSSVFGVLCKAV
jgi:hypothetical protein